MAFINGEPWNNIRSLLWKTMNKILNELNILDQIKPQSITFTSFIHFSEHIFCRIQQPIQTQNPNFPKEVQF